MAEGTGGDVPGAGSTPASRPGMIEVLDEAECLRLVASQEVGRVAYSGRYGPTVLPVNYRLFEGSVVFRTGLGSSLDEDLDTGIPDAEYLIAFEIDELHPKLREGWSVLIQGSVHRVISEEERASVERAGVVPWPSEPRERFLRIRPTRISGRRVRQHDGHEGA